MFSFLSTEQPEKSITADLFNGIGNIYLVKVLAAAECIWIYFCQAARENYIWYCSACQNKVTSKANADFTLLAKLALYNNCTELLLCLFLIWRIIHVRKIVQYNIRFLKIDWFQKPYYLQRIYKGRYDPIQTEQREQQI